MFITNMARYAIKGYEVDALDFVLKPVTYGQLALKLKKAMTIVASRERRYLMLPPERGRSGYPPTRSSSSRWSTTGSTSTPWRRSS